MNTRTLHAKRFVTNAVIVLMAEDGSLKRRISKAYRDPNCLRGIPNGALPEDIQKDFEVLMERMKENENKRIKNEVKQEMILRLLDIYERLHVYEVLYDANKRGILKHGQAN